MVLSCKQCSAPLPVADAVRGVVTCAFCGAPQTLPREVVQSGGRLISALDFRTPDMPGWRGTKHYTYQFGGAPPALRASLEDSVKGRSYPALETEGIYDDVDIAVSISFQEGLPGVTNRVGTRAGLSLRAAPVGQHQYLIHITNNGLYKVGVIAPQADGSSRYIDLVGWTRSSALDPTWGSTNRLRAIFAGDRLELRFNGQPVASLRDATHQQGQLQLLVNPDGLPAQVWFSDLRLAYP